MNATKKMKKSILITFLFTLSTFALPVFSANWYWLSESPIAKFTDSDWTMLKATAYSALDNGEDGVRVVWVNPETGNSGAITPLERTEKNGQTCRKAKFFSSAEGFTNTSVHYLCYQADGTWKLDK